MIHYMPEQRRPSCRHASRSARSGGVRRLLPLLLAVMTVAAGCARASAPSPAAAPQPRAVSQELALQTFDSAWSRIATTHYDTAFAGVDWHGVRDELRPRAAAVSTLPQLRAVITEMLERLGESHYSLIPGEAADALGDAGEAARHVGGDAGLELRLVDGRVLAWRVERDGPAAAAGIRMGWELEAVGDRAVAPLLERVMALPQAERRAALLRVQFQLNARLEGDVGDTLAMAFRDDAGRPRTIPVVLRRSPGEMVRFGHLPPMRATLEHESLPLAGGGCIGVIRMNVWMVPLMPAFDRAVDALRGCAGMVLDLRGNPGGVAGMIMGTAGHFLGDTVALGVMRTRTSELRFMANPRRASAAGAAVQPFAGPLAILIDEMSVSTSEIFAAGMQGVGRARVFGGRSAGEALPAAMVRLPTNDVLMHVVADFTGPGNVRIEGDGVNPDVPVQPTRAALLAGRDLPMETATEWIRHSVRNGNGGNR
jgi:carboxyl-terminal processing protease